MRTFGRQATPETAQAEEPRKNTGLVIMLKSLGLQINPEEIEQAFNATKEAIPQVVKKVFEMDERIRNMEETQTFILEEIRKLEKFHGVPDLKGMNAQGPKV